MGPSRYLLGHREHGDQHVDQRADAEHERHRADADVTAERDADWPSPTASRTVRVKRTLKPRAARPTMIPSRGPVPSPAPMYRPEPRAITMTRADDVGRRGGSADRWTAGDRRSG